MCENNCVTENDLIKDVGCVSSEGNDSDNQTVPPYTHVLPHLMKPSLANDLFPPTQIRVVTGDNNHAHNRLKLCSELLKKKSIGLITEPSQ